MSSFIDLIEGPTGSRTTNVGHLVPLEISPDFMVANPDEIPIVVRRAIAA